MGLWVSLWHCPCLLLVFRCLKFTVQAQKLVLDVSSSSCKGCQGLAGRCSARRTRNGCSDSSGMHWRCWTMGMGEGRNQHWQLVGQKGSFIACPSARHRGEVTDHAFTKRSSFHHTQPFAMQMSCKSSTSIHGATPAGCSLGCSSHIPAAFCLQELPSTCSCSCQGRMLLGSHPCDCIPSTDALCQFLLGSKFLPRIAWPLLLCS